MKIKTVIGLAGASAAASCVGIVALSGSAAYGAPAQHPPSISDIGIIYPSPNPTGQLPPADAPGVTVTGDCPTYLFGPAVGFAFQSGNAVSYRVVDGVPNGGNAAGIADLVIATPGTAPTMDNPSGTPPTNPLDTLYQGQAHVWFGDNFNANGHSYFGETIMFQGTAPNGATIKLTGNPGFNTSAGPGNQNGWGKLDITCTGTPFPLPTS